MNKKIIFSGIQPSGIIHLGNYIGAIKNWVKLQKDFQAIFCIVDLHAITVPQDPQKLQKQIKELAALYIACGINPKISTIFIQSSVPAHAELAWILNTMTYLPELERMTQFKDKSQKHKASLGLFDYPVLMAADILLYDTDQVPVGEDQTQHLELTRLIAKRFNQKFGETFKIPQTILPEKKAKRIMGLDDPQNKMSKSASSRYNFIALTDSAETIYEKIKKAVTDSGSEIIFSKDKPAISNLLTIYQELTQKKENEIVRNFEGKSYQDLKKELSEVVIEFLRPIQKKYQEILQDEKYLLEVLQTGTECACLKATQKINEVKKKVGLGI
jgi:tryptophanyl-tRNA synthetase